jgi:peptidoglycan/xylan/chitin deacetylase (PgdA/CDA1 family)
MLSVSNYHYIREDFTAKYPSIFGVTPRAFEQQLILLKNKGEFIKTSDLKTNYEEVIRSKDNYFLVTFDDGLKEQYENSLPILGKLNIDALFFVNSINSQENSVTTVHKIHLLRSILSPKEFWKQLFKFKKFYFSNIEKTKIYKCYRFDDKESAEIKYILNFKMPFLERELFINDLFKIYFIEEEAFKSLYMTDEQILQIANKGYLGSHSHSHFPLGLLSDNEIKFELEHSKKYLEKLTNTSIEIISYPYGTSEACTDNVIEFSEKAGYTIGFTTKLGVNTKVNNMLSLNRYDCNDLPGGKNCKM